MEILKLPFERIPQLSSRDKAYATGRPDLKPFYEHEVNIEAFAGVIDRKSQSSIPRKPLVEELQRQYASLETSEDVKNNIAALARPNTFTLITAHQPSLFTGPLYYIYKIFSTIHLAERLNRHYPDVHIVPVFISGGEDHDFEEINHTHLFNKTLVWENDESGSVGKMSIDNLQPVLAELMDILGDSENAQSLKKILQAAYDPGRAYGEAAFYLVNALFKDYGLVAINMSTPALKRLFIPIMEKELLEQPSKSLVEASQAKLEDIGFSAQAFARRINLFYLDDQTRERIEQEGDIFRVLNTDLQFTREEIRAELQAHPERFSPNVVMRPLYQESVLPNLAYIGGGGELAYWLERKEQFAHFGVPYPMLIRRNSVLWVDKGSIKRMQKLGLSLEELLEDADLLIKRYVKENTKNELSLKAEKKQIAQIYQGILAKAKEIDPTLNKSVKAEQAKLMNSLTNIEMKLIRAEKQRHEIAINQIQSLKNKLFPNNGLQERYDNFMGIYLQHGVRFFELLKEQLNPLEMGQFIVVIEK